MLRNLIFSGAIALAGCGVILSNGAAAADDDPDSVSASESSSRYSDKILGLKEQEDLPVSPRPLFEFGQPYLLEGPYDYEFELPTGMVVSPALFLFGNINTGPEITDNGVADTSVEWVTQMDLFLNLTLSGTERILVGIAPLQAENGTKTRYKFEPTSGFENENNLRLSTAFFEGEISEMFPKLDMMGRMPRDYEIAFGRQAVIIQDGIMINDTMDSVALTRSTIPLPGMNFARIGGLVAVNNVHRTNNKDDAEGELYGFFSSAEYHHATLSLDMAYVDSTEAIGDQFNLGGSLIQPFIILEHAVDTTVHIATSFAVSGETAHASDGTLIYTSFSWAPKQPGDVAYDNIIYLNAFGAFDNYAPAARNIGGPLGITGLLFAANGLAGPAIGNRANHAYGGALGYQMFFSPALRRNLIFEMGGKVDNSPGGIDRVGAAVRYSQALGRHVFFEIGGFAVHQASIDNGFGLRTKLNVIF